MEKRKLKYVLLAMYANKSVVKKAEIQQQNSALTHISAALPDECHTVDWLTPGKNYTRLLGALQPNLRLALPDGAVGKGAASVEIEAFASKEFASAGEAKNWLDSPDGKIFCEEAYVFVYAVTAGEDK